MKSEKVFYANICIKNVVFMEKVGFMARVGACVIRVANVLNSGIYLDFRVQTGF